MGMERRDRCWRTTSNSILHYRPPADGPIISPILVLLCLMSHVNRGLIIIASSLFCYSLLLCLMAGVHITVPVLLCLLFLLFFLWLCIFSCIINPKPKILRRRINCCKSGINQKSNKTRKQQ